MLRAYTQQSQTSSVFRNVSSLVTVSFQFSVSLNASWRPLKDSVEWELRCLFISESQTAAYLLGLATGFMFVVSWILRGLLIIVLLVWVNRTVHSQKATLFLSYHPRIQFDLVGGELDQIESMWERTRWGRTCYEAKPAATIKNNKQWMKIIPWILLYPPKTNCIIS